MQPWLNTRLTGALNDGTWTLTSQVQVGQNWTGVLQVSILWYEAHVKDWLVNLSEETGGDCNEYHPQLE